MSKRGPNVYHPPLTTLVALDCGHSNEFDLPAPEPRKRAYCRSCRDYRRVTKVN